ncbi:MAG: HypC/HybG/HupF family hydrogenase formation chaperone [Bacteroidales bacterium]
MCISIPAKIISIHNDTAKVSMEGNEYSVGIQMLDDVKEGDYVLVHTGFAIQKISEEDARETLKIIEEMKNL